MPKKKQKWKVVTADSVTEYQCGARAGERVRLRKDIVILDHRRKPTGEIHHAGENWLITKVSAVAPLDIWLRQPDGRAHTWDDNADFWDWFERVDDGAR